MSEVSLFLFNFWWSQLQTSQINSFTFLQILKNFKLFSLYFVYYHFMTFLIFFNKLAALLNLKNKLLLIVTQALRFCFKNKNSVIHILKLHMELVQRKIVWKIRWGSTVQDWSHLKSSPPAFRFLRAYSCGLRFIFCLEHLYLIIVTWNKFLKLGGKVETPIKW